MFGWLETFLLSLFVSLGLATAPPHHSGVVIDKLDHAVSTQEPESRSDLADQAGEPDTTTNDSGPVGEPFG